MGKLRVSRPSLRHDRELVREQIKFATRKWTHPVDKAGWWSFATFSWMTGLMYSSYRQPLQMTSIPHLSQKEACRLNSDVLEQLWTKEMALKSHPKFSRVLWLHSKKSILLTTLIFLVAIVLGFCSSVILVKRVLDWASDSDGTLLDGSIRVTLLIICEFFRVFFFTLTWALSYRTALRLKTSCMGMIYRKLFRLSDMSDKNAAKIINLISSDCHTIYEVVVSTQVAIGGPLILILGAIYICYELGYISLVGLLVFPASYPIQWLLAKLSASMRKKSINARDSRIMYLTQALHNLKCLKMFAWEKHFARLINESRSTERLFLLKSQLLHSFSVVLSPMLPHIGAITTFLLYIQAGNELTPAQGFTALFLFSLFAYATRTISRLLELGHQFRIATKRLEEVLARPEAHSHVPYNLQDDTDDAIRLERVTIGRRGSSNNPSWKDSDEELLSTSETDGSILLGDINLTVKKGKFIGICGLVGSGKSTFFEALSGSITVERGSLNVSGRIAYVPQEPWVFKGKLRDNVLFGEAFEPVWYYNVISSCCLVNDFGNFGQGDMTDTKDNGGNLSGGQKQRISLARALYHLPSREVFLLDDPFSGLDSRVAKTIFEKVVMEQLRHNKTVLLATHQMHFLKECDEILVFSGGQIVEQGSHQQLLADDTSLYASLVTAASPIDKNNSDLVELEDSRLLDCGTPIGAPVSQGPLQREALTKETGVIPWKAYVMYIMNAGGPLAMVLVLFAFALNIGSTAFSSWWLKYWFTVSDGRKYEFGLNNASMDDSTTDIIPDSRDTLFNISVDSPDFYFYRDFYLSIIAAIFFTSFLRTILFVWTTLRAAQNIHQTALVQFFRSRLRSVEKFGNGEVLHLFTRDIGEVDSGLPHSMEFLLQNIFLIISILFMVSLVFPVFLIPLSILCGVFILIRKIYNAVIRDLKRFDSEAKTPIFTLVNDTLSGLGTIRAFGKEAQMINRFENLVDSSNSVYYAFISAIRWLSFRLDILAVSVTASTAILVLVFHDMVSPASCGLALSYAAQLSGIFQFTVRMASEVEAKFVCVERLNTFLTLSQPEEDEEGRPLGRRPTAADALATAGTAHPNWPYSGRVKFDAATLSYSSSSSPVLKELSFEVHPGTKLGIIGRTGSGKSSIGDVLFRIKELRSGNIYVDDVNIISLPLGRLRNSLCVIPQDAAIFKNTIRFNLDPGNSHSDESLWQALEKVGLKGSIDSLDTDVALSIGQKQLLSIARAILRPSVVIFIDEATSNVDVETATLIDRLIVEEFSESTILIVAHRLKALKHCEYLLVMEDGELRDFGPIDVIARKPGILSHFEKFENIPL